MWKFNSVLCLLLMLVGFAAAQRSSNRTSLWQTLSGNEPLVIARGGFSGLFPDSSNLAYSFATQVSLPNVILWCDVQLTKDGAGICFPHLTLDNGSSIAHDTKKNQSTYPVNGIPMSGYFTVDFTLHDLENVSLTQYILSRSQRFDNSLQIQTVQSVFSGAKPPGFWLSVQHGEFFSQHNLSMRSFVISTSRNVIINYISSPEVNFLRSIMARFSRGITKLVFQFLDQGAVEPSTNMTYGSLLNNLTFIKTFASGILVPKSYIWPVDANLYLQPPTSLVSDAHRVGLEVFAANFVNDDVIAYNYSYDPLAEYLSFIDNGDFSVDGFLSDFPITPSEAIGCFSHLGKDHNREGKPLVISNEGASGDYPGCTDLAYTNAILDGVDFLDCPVQMTKDGIPFCLGSINLIDRTTAAQSPFINRSSNIPKLHTTGGIFSFSLTWSEIQSLTPVITNPFQGSELFRNPKFSKGGRLMTLRNFLALANNATSVTGVLIRVEHVAYLAEEQGLSVTDAILDALDEAGYRNQTMKKVMIQSSNSSVLTKFKEKSNYELVYRIDEVISGVPPSTITDIKKFAHAVVIEKSSIFPVESAFLVGTTDIVPKLQQAGFSVFTQLFNNEFVSQAWDFFADATVEINSYFTLGGVDGVVTAFPRTAARYKKNRCLAMGDNGPPYSAPVQPGLVQLIPPAALPPAEAPNPVLTDADVVEPPLPPAMKRSPPPGNGSAVAPTSPPPSGQSDVAACIFLSSLGILLATLGAF